MFGNDRSDEPRFSNETLEILEQLPCCPPMTAEDLKWCMTCAITHKEPSVWIVDTYIDGTLNDKTSVCNNHAIAWLVGSARAEDPFNCPMNMVPEKYVITKRETLN